MLDRHTYALHWTPAASVTVPRSLSLTLNDEERWMLLELRDALRARGIAAKVTVDQTVTQDVTS